MNNYKSKAVALVSGGLDSLLSVKLVEEQNIFVQGLFFETPFFGPKSVRENCELNNINLKVIPCFDEYKHMLLNPATGYGKHMNPCIDCHAFMLRKAADYLRENEFDFIITGEVLGERPMSQNRNSLNRVANLSTVPEIVLRPLSAKKLKPTKPELDGLIERDKLEDLSGRGRKRQIEMAEKYGITKIPQPGGGCLLTDKNFSKRLRFLIDSKKDDRTERDTHLLKVGRYIHLGDGALLIVGRNEKENEILQEKHNKEKDVLLVMLSHPGPIALIPNGGINNEHVDFSASVCTRYSDVDEGEKATVQISTPSRQFEIKSLALDDEEIKKRFI